ncbi:hypothetical protein EGD47_26040, partial [Salmonella enterica]|nr:hypothetical protein [Salmonella enterica]MJL38094.1 hypothetical protein [Salmonella enterica subsp. enterica serovar Minnesota]
GNIDSFTYLFSLYFFIKAKMQSFVYPCPIIQCSVSIIRKIVDIIVTRMSQIIQTSLAGRLRLRGFVERFLMSRAFPRGSSRTGISRILS